MIFNIYQGLLSCIFITIPEYSFMIIITLWLMKRKDLLDLYNLRYNLISILKITIPPALLLNALDFIISTPTSFNKIISFISLYIFSILLLNTKEHSYIEYPKMKRKALIFFFISLLLAVAIESITFPIILKLVNKSYDEIKLNIYLVIICSLAPRIIDVLILAFIFIRKNNKFQINIGDYIFSNKVFFRSTLAIIIFLIVREAFFIKLIIYNNLLSISNNIYGQLLIVIGSSFFTPAFIGIIAYICLNHCIMVINSEKQSVFNDKSVYSNTTGEEDKIL